MAAEASVVSSSVDVADVSWCDCWQQDVTLEAVVVVGGPMIGSPSASQHDTQSSRIMSPLHSQGPPPHCVPRVMTFYDIIIALTSLLISKHSSSLNHTLHSLQTSIQLFLWNQPFGDVVWD